ncbi:MAG TPA: MFS transporter [Verrucomicrobiae bacterium]|jgi:MFS family permease|nr:MFS transporter [Verrucomicrobiae bacterium]
MKINALRALKHRNFRLFFCGQSVSLVGTWMTRLATSWLVYRLTGSTFLLGVIGFAGQIPTFLMAPVAGVWVDRWDRRRVLLVTQLLAALQSLLLAGLTLSGHINIWEIACLSMFQGLINAFDMPARQSFLVQMVNGREDLGNAIALNSTMVNGARLLGPALAGITIAAVGEGWCFLIDGLSYFAVIASLLAMKVTVEPTSKSTASMLAQLREGWTYVSTFPPIRTVLLMFAIVSFMGIPYTVLMPVFASTILHGGPHTLGFLMGAAGVGAFISALTLAARKSVRGLYRVIPAMAALFGVGLMAFSFSQNFWLSVALMAVTGFGMMQLFAASNTVIQTIVDDDKRGRVMSYWTMAYMGASPFGSLLAGSLAPAIGAPGTVLLCGTGCVLGAVWFWLQIPKLRPIIRPIYQKLGILPVVPVAPVAIDSEN